jgi:hypothetical protein
MYDENNNGLPEGDSKEAKKRLIIIGVIVVVAIALFYYVFVASCIVSHTWTEATCEAPKTCLKCGKTEGETLEHNVQEWETVKEPTCIETGSKVGVCLVCRNEVTESVAKSEHTYGEVIVTKAATCTASGTQTKKCTVCGNEVNENIPATDHNLVCNKVIQYASLNTQGNKEYQCTSCGATVNIAYDLSDTEKSNINLVMNNTLNDYPSKTIGTAFNAFFSDPVWYADGNYVAFKGGCNWQGSETNAIIGFQVSGSQFKLSTFTIGGTTYDSTLVLRQFMNTVYAN